MLPWKRMDSEFSFNFGVAWAYWLLAATFFSLPFSLVPSLLFAQRSPSPIWKHLLAWALCLSVSVGLACGVCLAISVYVCAGLFTADEHRQWSPGVFWSLGVVTPIYFAVLLGTYRALARRLRYFLQWDIRHSDRWAMRSTLGASLASVVIILLMWVSSVSYPD